MLRLLAGGGKAGGLFHPVFISTDRQTCLQHAAPPTPRCYVLIP